MRILDKYICRTVIMSTLLVMLVFLMLEMFVFLTNQIGDVGKGQYSLVVMLLYIILKLPVMIYMMFPIIAFLGCLVGLSQLAKGSELTVTRVSGLSIFNITQITVIAAIMMVTTMTVLGEFGVARLEQYAIQLRLKALGQHQSQDNIWLHQPGRFLNLGKVIDNNTIQSITEFNFQNRQLSSVIFSPQAVLKNHQWVLPHAEILKISDGSISKQTLTAYPLTFHFSSKELLPYQNDSLDGSIWRLYKIIQRRKEAGLIATLYEYEFWHRIVQPFTTILMICLGVPFVFGSLRGRGATSRLAMGVGIGVIYYFISRIFGPISLVFQLSPLLAAIIPTLVVGVIYLFFVRRLV